MPKPTRSQIDHFLSAKRIVVIGVSRQPREYSRMLFDELLKHGYDAIPVNPSADLIEDKPCYKSIKDINPAPDRALILLPDDKAEQALLDCAEAGIHDLWLYGATDPRIVSQAQEKGLNLISGLCMFMFLPQCSFIHRFHGGILKLVGAYPK